MDVLGRPLCKTIKNRHFYPIMNLHFLFISFLFDRKKSGFHLGAILVGEDVFTDVACPSIAGLFFIASETDVMTETRMKFEFADSPLPTGFIDRYKDRFIPSYCAPFAIQHIGRNWYTETRKNVYLTDDKIGDHLCGDYYIGPVAKTSTKTITIDLDRHGNNWRSLEKRTEAVCGAFSEASPVIFSTPSGGMHVAFMLELPAWKKQAAGFARERLTDAGVEIRDGSVEVYPSNRALRAPLGHDCYLLDNDTFDPVDVDREANLYTLDQILQNEQYDCLTIPPDYQASTIPQSPQKASRRRQWRSTSEYMQRCDQWLYEGLTEPSQRNQAFLDLHYYYRVVEGLDADRAEDALWAWINQFHNHHSKEFNADPEGVRRKVRDVVRSWKPHLVGTKSEKVTKPSKATRKSTIDIDARIRAYADQNALGHVERCFLVDLLAYAHRRGRDTPDGSHLLAEIPSATLKKFHWQYGRLLRELLDAGVVEKEKNYGTKIKRCNTYRLPCLDR